MIEIVADPDPSWPRRFTAQASGLRGVWGSRALRIDHIGSTAVAGLAAKDVVDIQVTVGDAADLVALDDPQDPVRQAMSALGYVFEAHNPDRRKRFFRRRHAGDDTNVHVRSHGCVSQQHALLLRDYLRADASARTRYAQVKHELAARDWPSVDDYADAKSDVVWTLLRAADRWAWLGWCPGPSDG